ncbi:MAG: general secretion pathway protein N [Marinobacter sp. T13-3]|nr:MAG: general secretion pathway protein N [Marinobacter sp. T13-3]
MTHTKDTSTDTQTARVFGWKGYLGLGVIAALTFAGNLITSAPAGWVAQQTGLIEQLPPGVTVQGMNGSLFSGTAAVTVENHPAHLNWQAQWPTFGQITSGALPVNWQVETVESALSGDLTATLTGAVNANAKGTLHIPEFAHLIERHGGAMIEGDVRVTRAQLSWDGQRLTEARAMAYWPGGNVQYPAGNPTLTTELPPLELTAGPDGNALRLTITESGNTAPLAQADLAANGMAELQVYGRLLTLADQPGFEHQPSTPVMQVSHPLFTYAGGR